MGINSALTFSALNGNPLSLTDVDVRTDSMLLTINISAGTVNLSTLAGLSGSGDGTGSLSYTGTLTALNTALNGLTYHARAPPTTTT